MNWKRTTPLPLVALVCLLGAALFWVAPLQAQTRTTPVQVTNLLGIDPSNNTVKSQQLGTWSVAITGTPTVTAAQSGTWNATVSGTVGISGTPSVSIANSPTVSIDTTNNLVTTQARSSVIAPFASDTQVPTLSGLFSSVVDCTGYREARVMVTSSACNDASLLVCVFFKTAGGMMIRVGIATFAVPPHSITDQANFVPECIVCSFTIPIMGPQMQIQVWNQTGITRWVYANKSSIYLVN